MAKNDISKITKALTKYLNPLRGLTETAINQMLENMRGGNDVKLQLAFEQIEKVTPIFGICISKRLAGICNRKWDVVPSDESAEAKAQADTVKKILLESDTKNINGLTEALRHLGMASFRGRSCIKAFFDESNRIHFKKIPNTNTLEWNDRLYWNPKADTMVNFMYDETVKDIVELSDEEVCWIKEERPIDIPGLQVYLRQLVGETNWARFVEKEGIPQVILTAPDGTPDNALDTWNARAMMIFEGGSGTLPSGSSVNQLTAARGLDPFSAYIEHQMRMICILAVGSTGSILGDVGAGLGSDVVTKQEEQFNDLVSYDCKRIQNALNTSVVKKCVRQIFKTDNMKCRFEFVEQDNVSPKEYLELAATAKNMGITIDVAKLKELTGLQFIKDSGDMWTPVEQKEA